MLIRLAEAKDENALLIIRNDSLTRANSFQTDLISPEEHHEWYKKKLNDHNSCIYVMENERQQVVAQARYDRFDLEKAEVNIAVDNSSRGKGLGKQILSQSLLLAKAQLILNDVFALVKNENVVSQKLFLSCGFQIFSKTEEVYKFIFRS